MNSEKPRSPYTVEQTHLTLSEVTASLFPPDTLLSTQYFDHRRRNAFLEPEKKLMLAILEDAIQCFQANYSARCGKRKRLFDDARKWIFESCDEWVFGFENICSALEFCPDYIREGLLRWWQRELAKRRSAPLWHGTKASPARKGAPESAMEALVGPRSNIEVVHCSLYK